MSGIDAIFSGHRVMVILRGLATPSDAVAAASRVWDAGIELVEVPIGEPSQCAMLSAVVAEGRRRGKNVGAGTVVSAAHVEMAANAGAVYTVAPGFDAAVAELSHSASMPHLPGVATPTEVQRAQDAGFQWVKVFPAEVLGPRWFAAISGPFPRVRYMATGGVAIEDAPAYFDSGAHMVAFGASATASARVEKLAHLVRRYG